MMKTISTEKIYKGRVFELVKDIIELPDGNTAVREVVNHPGGACVLPVDDDGNVIFVRQYRHPLKTYTLEIPAGLLEPGEAPIVCAARELEEETGFTSDNIIPFTEIYATPGFCTEKIHIFFAAGLKPGKQNFDADEFINTERYPLEKALEMIYNGEIKDGKTIVAILGYSANCSIKKEAIK